MNNELKFIGEIKTPYNTLKECPKNITPDGPICEVAIYDEYKDGLYGLEAGQKVMLLYWMYKDENRKATIGASHHAPGEYGTFAKRSPSRPNPIGIGVLEIVEIKGNSLFVNGMDCLNDTLLLDIKPAIRDELTMK